MNYYWYSNGNPIKVMFRKHHCPACGNILSKTKHKKVVDKKSLEAKNYSFHSYGAAPVSSIYTFIHKVFYCPNCQKTIEYVTQTNLEDIDIIIRKVKKEYCKFSKIELDKISIKKVFEKYDGVLIEKIDNVEEITTLHIVIEESGKTPITMKFPIYRENSWERPYRFDIKKKDLVWWI